MKKALGLLLSAVCLGSPPLQAEDLGELFGAQTVSAQNEMGDQGWLSRFVARGEPEQNIFLQFYQSGQYEKALFQWNSAFAQSAFAQTPNGKALYAYLLAQNKLPILGLERLFEIQAPAAVQKELLQSWKKLATLEWPAWRMARIQWTSAWSQVFDTKIQALVLSRLEGPETPSSEIKKMLAETSPDSQEGARLQWKLANALIQENQIGEAAKNLKLLLNRKEPPVDKEVLNLWVARLLYQEGFLPTALQFYSQIPKTSEYWYEAAEESAWTNIRLGEAKSASAWTSDILANRTPRVGPEAYFAEALVGLKLCQYQRVAKDLTLFQGFFRARLDSMKALAASSEPANLRYLLNRKEGAKRTLELIKMQRESLPRDLVVDIPFAYSLQALDGVREEAKTAALLYDRSVTGGTAMVGYQASMDEFRKVAERRVKDIESSLYGRVKTLALAEAQEIEQLRAKMQLVETELMQRAQQLETPLAQKSGGELASTEAQSLPLTEGTAAKPALWFTSLQGLTLTDLSQCPRSKN